MKVKTIKRFLQGFALPAMLLPMSLGSLLLFSASSVLHPQCWRNQIAISPRLTQQDRDASDVLSQDFRAASSVQSATANHLVLNSWHGTVAYSYNPAARTVTRVEGAKSEILLTGVDSFSFSLFQRPGIQDAFNHLMPAKPENAKLVACHWSCSEGIAGTKLDSDSFQLAPTLLRGR
jgi:hypothetical protein